MVLVHILLTLAGLLVLWPVLGKMEAAAFAIGSAFVIANVLIIAGIWHFTFHYKKPIALSGLVIVFKYLFFGIILYKAVNTPWLSKTMFCLGLTVFVLTAVLTATATLFTSSAEEAHLVD